MKRKAEDETIRTAVEDLMIFAALDRRIGEMRELLAEMQPPTTATALKALRDAFPDVPLDTRMRTLAETRH